MPNIRDFDPVLPDPQFYVEKALALYERVVREKRGRVVFISAELGGGKTEHLSAVAKALHQTKPEPNFIAGFFRSGEYSRHLLDWQETINFDKTTMATGGFSSLLSLCPIQYAFAASFIGQLLQTSVYAREFADTFKKNQLPGKESADWLRDLLRHAAEERPLVCLLDDWDEAQRFYWDSMLFSFAREIAQDLPLLLFITIKEPINFHSTEKDGSGLTEVIKSLTGKGLAEWWPLKKLTRDEVAAAIGDAAPGIVSKLHSVTGGNARWVKELWREWRLNEIVLTDGADRWVWGIHHKATVNLYKDILEDRLKRLLKEETAMVVEDAREVLACAALEGIHFTADTIALAMNWDKDELIDFLDDVLVQSEDNPDGLLAEDDAINIVLPEGHSRILWRYHFVSDLHWMALDRYGFATEQRPEKAVSERQEKSAALVKALLETYTPEERLVAAQLARLLHDTGHKDEAQNYQRIADYIAQGEVMRKQALYLLAINKDDWESWQCRRAAEFLIVAGGVMISAFSYNETLLITEEAGKLANRIKDREIEAYIHYRCGFILHGVGEYKLARERARKSLDIYRLVRKKAGTVRALYVLAMIELAEGHYNEARLLIMQMLKITQDSGNRVGTAPILYLSAMLCFAEGHHAQAREQVTRGLKIELESGNRKDAISSLNLLARIQLQEGSYREARDNATQALKIAQEINHRDDLSVSLILLAWADYISGNHTEAREHGGQALKITLEIGNRENTAAALHVLSTIDEAMSDYAQARERATQALMIAQEIHNPTFIATASNLLARINLQEGNYAEARDQATQALIIAQELNQPQTISNSLDILAQANCNLGDYVKAREQATQASIIAQELGDQSHGARSLYSLAIIAYKLELLSEAFSLISLGSLILAQIDHVDKKRLQTSLSNWFAECKYSKEQQQVLLHKVSEAYLKDNGKELIETVLVSLREACD